MPGGCVGLVIICQVGVYAWWVCRTSGYLPGGCVCLVGVSD